MPAAVPVTGPSRVPATRQAVGTHSREVTDATGLRTEDPAHLRADRRATDRVLTRSAALRPAARWRRSWSPRSRVTRPERTYEAKQFRAVRNAVCAARNGDSCARRAPTPDDETSDVSKPALHRVQEPRHRSDMGRRSNRDFGRPRFGSGQHRAMRQRPARTRRRARACCGARDCSLRRHGTGGGRFAAPTEQRPDNLPEILTKSTRPSELAQALPLMPFRIESAGGHHLSAQPQTAPLTEAEGAERGSLLLVVLVVAVAVVVVPDVLMGIFGFSSRSCG